MLERRGCTFNVAAGYLFSVVPVVVALAAPLASFAPATGLFVILPPGTPLLWFPALTLFGV